MVPVCATTTNVVHFTRLRV